MVPVGMFGCEVIASRGWPRQLSRRPPKRAAAQQMQMQMENGLAGPAPCIHDCSVAVLEVMLLRQLGGDAVQMADDRLVCFFGLCGGSKVFPRNQQQMHRGLWIDVLKSDAAFVLIDNLGGHLACQDFAKNAGCHEFDFFRTPDSVG